MSTCIYVTHPHPDVLSDSSKVARYTQDQAIRVRSFILKRQGDQIKLERVRTAGGTFVYIYRFCTFIVASWNHEQCILRTTCQHANQYTDYC